MEPALKQRLIGAAVLVAIAVIFLPMLIKGPAPESGVSDISLDLPGAPKEGFETRELPLVTPPARDGSSVVASDGESGGDGPLPTVDTRGGRGEKAGSDMTSAGVAAGNYAVSFGSYASESDAGKVVDALHAAGLAAFQEAVKSNDRTLHRVRIGPFQTNADAESARIASAKLRKDVGAKVVVLDADAERASKSVAAATSKTSENTPDASVAAKPKPEPSKPATPNPDAADPAATASKPAEPDPAPAKPEPAASGVGFVVQLGAFGSQADAVALRDRARGQGLSAFVEQVRSADGKTLNRVQVGPVADRAAAEQLKAQAAGKLGIPGFVRSHP